MLHCTWLERVASGKHKGLLGPFISYEENEVLWTSYLVKSPSPNFGLGLRPGPPLVYHDDRNMFIVKATVKGIKVFITQDAGTLRAYPNLGGLGLGHFLEQRAHERGQLFPSSRQLLVDVTGPGILVPADTLRQNHLDLVLVKMIQFEVLFLKRWKRV